MMGAVGAVVWWLVQNSYRITGFNVDEARQQIASLGEENTRLKRELETSRSTLIERDRQLQIEKASQTELARNVSQLQEENATLKEDLGFLRKLMSSGTTPEGIGVSELKIEREGTSNEYRYRMLLTQGGQRKQDFKGRIQVVARVSQGTTTNTLTFPDPALPETATAFEFRFYHKVEGRFRIPDGSALKAVDVRILVVPGGQVKLSRTITPQ
jgi:regulator of replication initiation timing